MRQTLVLSWDNLMVGRPFHWGQVLPMQVQFGGQIKGELKVSLRLVAPDGEKVAQNDRRLMDTLNVGLFVPPHSTAGVYTLAAVVYDPNTLEPLLDMNGLGEVPLALVVIEEGWNPKVC
ncbi:MAG: hypothetical protein AAF639_40810 [Chloroflexota bacterium]